MKKPLKFKAMRQTLIKKLALLQNLIEDNRACLDDETFAGLHETILAGFKQAARLKNPDETKEAT